MYNYKLIGKFNFFTFPSRLSYWYSERHKLRSSFTTRILVYFQPSMRKYLVIIAHRPPIYPIAVDNWVSFSHRIARTLFVRSSQISFIENFIKHLHRIARNRWTEPQATSLHIDIAFSNAMAHSDKGIINGTKWNCQLDIKTCRQWTWFSRKDFDF